MSESSNEHTTTVSADRYRYRDTPSDRKDEEPMICKICHEELVDFGPKFLTHKYQNRHCAVYLWDRKAYATVKEEPEEVYQKGGDDEC